MADHFVTPAAPPDNQRLFHCHSISSSPLFLQKHLSFQGLFQNKHKNQMFPYLLPPFLFLDNNCKLCCFLSEYKRQGGMFQHGGKIPPRLKLFHMIAPHPLHLPIASYPACVANASCFFSLNKRGAIRLAEERCVKCFARTIT